MVHRSFFIAAGIPVFSTFSQLPKSSAHNAQKMFGDEENQISSTKTLISNVL